MEELAEGVALGDRYLLGPVIGHGAMGRVHLAEDTRLVRPVAVKSLRPELARYPDVRERFGQEARAAARINHPNVVRVYDSGERGRIPYLVMECLPGSTLVDELAWGPLEPRRARRVGLDVLGALDAAHRMGVVHRDVKPGNILLSAALDGPVKVSDFGIAKSADDRNLTDSGSLVGTAAYLAPERVAGGPATPASDVYSLGVVLYEALAGRRPYEGETSLAVALAIHMGGAPGLHELRPDLDPELAAVVDRAIARDPAERWESASAMAEALRAWRPSGPTSAGLDPLTGAMVLAPTGLPTVTLLGGPLEPDPEATQAGAAVPGDVTIAHRTAADVDDRPTQRLDEDVDDLTRSVPPAASGVEEPNGARPDAGLGGPLAPPVSDRPDLDSVPQKPFGPGTTALQGSGAGGVADDIPRWRRTDQDVAPVGVVDDAAGHARRPRRQLGALVGAGAAVLLLIGAVVAATSRPDGAPSDASPTTTATELVAGSPTSEATPPEASTLAPVRVVPPTTARSRRPATAATAATTATTATTAPPTTRPAPTTTAPPETRPTTRPPTPPTAPPTSTVATAPPTTTAAAA